jgi:cation:H+ antiporter
MIDLTQFNIAINLALFAAAATAVWIAGTRLIAYANALSVKTGIGHAVIGMVLLAGITSMPEFATVFTSAAIGAVNMAVGDMFGSIALQVVILAIADFVIGSRALTSRIPDPQVLLQAGLNILLLAIAAAGIVVGDVPILGIGAWLWGILIVFLCGILLLAQAQNRTPWLPAKRGRVDTALSEKQEQSQQDVGKDYLETPLRGIVIWIAGLGLVILTAGFLLANAGDAIAKQSGLGGDFIGFAFLAIATSLPELSTTLAAARKGLFTLAISEILGTNLINVGMLFPTDAIAGGEPILSQVGEFSAFSALLGIVLTTLLMIGLAERGNKTVLRLGFDSAAMFTVYAVGLVILFNLR